MGKFHPAVRWWLVVGVVMVIGQIVIGGITRLTESGLSITEWEPLSGAMPPLNAADWEEEFAKYRESPQYEKIFADISMADFKFIYFWEWFHRQWARIMGLVFIVGFLVFWRKGYLNGKLMRRLGIVVALAALAASFGWIMVASGLIDRPWVNAYKLTLHLAVGLTLFSYLLWVTLKAWNPQSTGYPHKSVYKWLVVFSFLLVVQLLLGGVMSGAKAALPYPTWPDMNGKFIPDALMDQRNWNVDNLIYYERNLFQPALFQFLHRMTAYILFFSGLYLVYRLFKRYDARDVRAGGIVLVSVLITQVLLGIATVVSSIGQVPVGLGVAHQATAVAVVAATVYLHFLFRPGKMLITVEKKVEKR